MNVERNRRRNVTMFFMVCMILSAVSMQSMCGEAVAGPYATCNYPADGEAIEGDGYPFTGPPYTHIWTTLNFFPGDGAVKHTGYCSDNYDDVLLRVQDANLGEPPWIAAPYRYYVGLPDVPPYVESLVRGVTYYWCVDETDAVGTTYPGDIWEFTIMDYKASNPSPPDEAVIEESDVLLTWSEGIEVQEHDVYIGTDEAAVEAADQYDTTGIYKGYVLNPQYQCTGLSYNTTYYWRIDEVSGRIPPIEPGTIYKGDVWCFTTCLGMTIEAFVDIDPDILNLASQGQWLSCNIWLPPKYSVTDIEADSIVLENEIEPQRFSLTEDEEFAVARFYRSDVLPILEVGDIELTITGLLTDGTLFEARDTIKVIDSQ